MFAVFTFIVKLEFFINYLATKRTHDVNNQDVLSNLINKQDSLTEELESLRETVIKMQEESKF